MGTSYLWRSSTVQVGEYVYRKNICVLCGSAVLGGEAIKSPAEVFHIQCRRYSKHAEDGALVR